MFNLLLSLALTTQSAIHQEVNLVTVPVTVMNMQGALVTGLQAGHFQIFEDGEEQEILYCSIEDAPVSIGIVFDRSGSMADKINISTAALTKFLAQANSQDEFSLVAFNDRAFVATQWTDNPNELIQDLLMSGEPPKGKTSLIDALYLMAAQMKTARNSRKAILLITDGGDNHSRYTEIDVKRALKETDIQLYAIGVFDFNPNIGQFQAKTLEELQGPTLLEELTTLSGGLAYIGGQSQKQLEDIAVHLGRTLRDQYTLAYRPSAKKLHDGKYHKLKVKIHRLPKGVGPLIPFARYGYKGKI